MLTVFSSFPKLYSSEQIITYLGTYQAPDEFIKTQKIPRKNKVGLIKDMGLMLGEEDYHD